MQPQHGAGHVPGQAAHQRQQTPEEDINGVVAGQGGGQSFPGELALARPYDPDDGQRAQAAKDVRGGRAAAV
jgi:hypothetical protein